MLKDLAQPSHLLILAIIIVVLFGWKKLPDAARSVGRSMRIFKSEMSEMKSDGKESKPSPAATDTVPGVVPKPPAAPQQAPQQAQQAPQHAQQRQQAAQQAAHQAPHDAPPAYEGSVDAPVGPPQVAEPARHDNPAR